ncbi:MAG: ABC transporter ATP-binding protein [Hyphomicrobiales bacterium]
MASITLNKLNKSFGALTVVHDIDLSIADKEFIILVGPSGCGKSTTLRMIAGLAEVTSGDLVIGDTIVNDVPPKDRDIAMVFQNYALYPHMTVFKNMAFGLELRRADRDLIDRKVRHAAEVLDITHLLNRKPKALSGGQRQRVALGRAMVRSPEVFLLDEPLSNLDAKLRAVMRAEITKLHRQLDATFVYVTHDQIEAMTMADRIVVMNEGRIQQVAPPQELYDNPANMFVAGFIGAPRMNFFDAEIRKNSSGHVAIVAGIKMPLPARLPGAHLTAHEGQTVKLGLRPEAFHASPDGVQSDMPLIEISGTVELTEPMGSEVHLTVKTAETEVIARVSPRTQARNGNEISLFIDMSMAHVFDTASGLSLMMQEA